MEDIQRPFYDIFPPRMVDISTDSFQYIDYKDINLNNANGVNDYRIEINDRISWFLLDKSYFEYKFSLADANGAQLTANDNVSLQNNAVGLMQRYEFLLDDKIVDYVDDAHLCNTVQNLVYFSDEHSKTVASQQLWYPDSADTTNSDYIIPIAGGINVGLYGDGIDSVNLGHRKRRQMLDRTIFSVQIPLRNTFGLLKSLDYVIKGIKLGVRLVRNSNSNLILGTNAAGNPFPNGQVIMHEVKWWIPRVKPNASVLPSLESKLTGASNYIVDFIDVQSYRSNLVNEQAVNRLFQIRTKRQRPVKVFIVFQNQNRVTGNASFVKRVFDTVNLSKMYLTLNGVLKYPEREYNVNFANAGAGSINDYARVYSEFLRCGLRDHDIDQGTVVTFDMFKSLYPIFCFDLSERDEFNVVSESALIDIYWSTTAAPATPYYMYVFIESERKLEFGASEGQVKLIGMPM
ncbi:MAG TPA: hypothetical protein PLS50_02505 [Candidatus Dojkabacteria bacterium]|nr:hypothetical protein [Candidatus Dojkabacteria bacterium]